MIRVIFGLVLAAVSLVSGSSLAMDGELTMTRLVPNSIAEKIHAGMTRAEVETYLKEQDGGPQSISSTRYYQAPGLIIEVPYDQAGGTWTRTNRVSGPLNVRTGSRSTL